MRNDGSLFVKFFTFVAVAVPMAAMAPPYLRQELLQFRAELSADEIADDLLQARAAAVSRNRVVKVAFREADKSWLVDEAFRDKLPDGVALAGPQRDILFYPDGSSSGGQVVVAARGEAWAMAVDLGTGAVRRRHAR